MSRGWLPVDVFLRVPCNQQRQHCLCTALCADSMTHYMQATTTSRTRQAVSASATPACQSPVSRSRLAYQFAGDDILVCSMCMPSLDGASKASRSLHFSAAMHLNLSAFISSGGLGQRDPGRSCDMRARNEDLQLVRSSNLIATLQIQGLAHYRGFLAISISSEACGASRLYLRWALHTRIAVVYPSQHDVILARAGAHANASTTGVQMRSTTSPTSSEPTWAR